MATKTITLDDVIAAVIALIDEGIYPSVGAVRERLKTTCNQKYLCRLVREARAIVAAKEKPDMVASPETMAVVQREIDRKVAAAVAPLQEELQLMCVEREEEAGELDAIIADRDELRARVVELERVVIEKDGRIQQLQADQQIKQNRLDELVGDLACARASLKDEQQRRLEAELRQSVTETQARELFDRAIASKAKQTV